MAGTVGYMSPEQIRGGTLDSRSDIFALGCLLYELLTGQRAFQTETPQKTIRAILDQDPTPIGELRPDVDPTLQMIVMRCLEKRREERFESARDVAFALRALTGAGKGSTSVDDEKSASTGRTRLAIAAVAAVVLCAVIAWVAISAFNRPKALPETIRLGVVPFTAPAEDVSLGAFAEGLRLDLAEDLALVAQQEQGIGWVVPTAMSDKNDALSPARLGEIFGATLAIDGHVVRVGDRIRLMLDLRDPKTGDTLRQVVIEDAPSNIEAFQHGPAYRVAERLGVVVTDESRKRIDASSTTMTGAFDAFVRGRGTLALAVTPEEDAAAVELIGRVVDEDPLFSGGWVRDPRADSPSSRTPATRSGSILGSQTRPSARSPRSSRGRVAGHRSAARGRRGAGRRDRGSSVGDRRRPG